MFIISQQLKHPHVQFTVAAAMLVGEKMGYIHQERLRSTSFLGTTIFRTKIWKTRPNLPSPQKMK